MFAAFQKVPSLPSSLPLSPVHLMGESHVP